VLLLPLLLLLSEVLFFESFSSKGCALIWWLDPQTMLRNFANYLLGTAYESQEEKTSTTEQQSQQSLVDNDQQFLRLTTTSTHEGEDDWILVDRDSEGNSELSSESDESESEPNVTETEIPTTNVNTTRCLSRASSTSSLPAVFGGGNVMEESWFITPPPCFTSTGPVLLETSPLENLLIEHPSMSVYHHQNLIGYRRSALASSPRALSPSGGIVNVVVVDEEIVEEADEDDTAEVRLEEEVRAIQQMPRRVRAVEEIREKERQGMKQKQAQKVQVQKAYQNLKRGYLERNNKAREVNCRNQRLRRGERSQGATRSHANNNRKC